MTDTAIPSDADLRLAEARRRRVTLLMIALVVLFVLVPFLFWRDTWFGRALTDEEMGQYLADGTKPRPTQQSLPPIG